jgi:methionine sulfoxide reductase heme-binding subunit
MSSLVVAAAGPSAYWYLSRGTGAVALVLLTVSVVVGILGTIRFAAPRWPRFAIDSLHRDVSLLALALLVLHIVMSVLDTFAPISAVDSVIPFMSKYRPLWMGLGTLSFDLFLALVVTSLVRRRLGYRAWRAIHWLAYASWPVAVLHGLGTGSDVKLWWMLALTAVCVAAVVIAVLVRIGRTDPGYAGLRAPAVALSIAAPIGLAIFALAGPLQQGWARRAGTPASLLPKPVASVPAASAPASRAPRSLTAPFTAHLDGKVVQTPEPAGAILDLALRLSGGVQGQLRIRLAGAPLSSGGLSLTGSQVDLAEVGAPSVLQGQIVSLQGQQFTARVSAGGTVLNLRANLNIDGQTGAVTGTLSGAPA